MNLIWFESPDCIVVWFGMELQVPHPYSRRSQTRANQNEIVLRHQTHDAFKHPSRGYHPAHAWCPPGYPGVAHSEWSDGLHVNEEAGALQSRGCQVMLAEADKPEENGFKSSSCCWVVVHDVRK